MWNRKHKRLRRWKLRSTSTQKEGNIKPSKKKSTEKIDGIVALVMALGSYMTEGGHSSIYDDRGLLML